MMSITEQKTKPTFLWNLHYACNYRCPYCLLRGRWQDLALNNRQVPLAEWMMAWQRIYERYGRVHIEIGGGEPFSYPDFVRLMTLLSQRHMVSITTNLSQGIEEFVSYIDCHNVNIICAFHPLYVDVDSFIKKVLILKERKLAHTVVFWAYPAQLRLFDYYARRFQEKLLGLSVRLFRGEFDGRVYPQGYTEQERSLILPYLAESDTEELRLGSRLVKGNLCNAGRTYCVIQPNGQVVRCSAEVKEGIFGDFFDQGFKLLDEPLPCEIEICPRNECVNLLVSVAQDSSVAIDRTVALPAEANKGQLKVDFSKEALQVSSDLNSTSYKADQLLQDKELINEKDNISTVNRSQIPPYRVFFTWFLHFKCNYNCTYCSLFHDGSSPEVENRYIDTDRWIDIWQDVKDKYGECELHLTGGEPFTYPGVMDLITKLSKIHTLEFATNFSWEIRPFIDNIPPERVRVGVSFQPEFANFESFLDKVVALHTRGYEIWVNYVAYPPFLKNLGTYKKRVEELGIHFSILSFNGSYAGHSYPKDYTQAERELIGCNTQDETNEKRREWDFGEDRHRVKAKVCRMGQMYAKINPDGQVYRCCTEKGNLILGNIIDGTFRLLEEPQLCTSDNCPCWKSMIVGEEARWQNHWVGPRGVNLRGVD